MGGSKQDWHIARAQQTYIFIIVTSTAPALVIAFFSFQRLFLLPIISHHFLSRGYTSSVFGQMFKPHATYKISIYNILCVSDLYRNQDGEKRKRAGSRAAAQEAR